MLCFLFLFFPEDSKMHLSHPRGVLRFQTTFQMDLFITRILRLALHFARVGPPPRPAAPALRPNRGVRPPRDGSMAEEEVQASFTPPKPSELGAWNLAWAFREVPRRVGANCSCMANFSAVISSSSASET